MISVTIIKNTLAENSAHLSWRYEVPVLIPWSCSLDYFPRYIMCGTESTQPTEHNCQVNRLEVTNLAKQTFMEICFLTNLPCK
jgi:hypothetical protein